MNHYYVFFYRNDSAIPFYDRTMPDAGNAKQCVEKHEAKGRIAFYTVNCLPKEYWY